MSVLVASVAFLLSIGALAVADGGSFLLARARAQAAADAAALAAVVEQVPALARG
ncbi:MAG: pilus assembly protein TadG-related protein, partial [Actinomycetota bacterium]